MNSHLCDDEMYPGLDVKLTDETVLSCAGPDGTHFWVNNYNWKVTKKHWLRSEFHRVTIVAVDNCPIVLPVHDILDRIRDCDLIVKLVDSLFFPTDPLTDAGRLQLILDSRGNTLKGFFGHLDQAGIAMLPHTIKILGLAIRNSVDAAAVLGMQTWKGLDDLYVALAPGVALEDLGPLPAARQYGIMFTSLTDDRVPMVVPAIAALAPKLTLSGLYFPKSQLTADGGLRLAESIRDMESLEVKYAIVVEPTGDWQPDENEKSKISKIFLKKMIIRDMYWSMNWMYK